MNKVWNKRAAQAIAATLSLIMLMIIVTGCGNKLVSTEASDKRTVISIMAPLHFPDPPSKEVLSQIEQLTNTKLEINWVPDGIYTDKMTTALTTNTLKKATFVKHTDYKLAKNAIRSDAFWEIGPYLERFSNLRHLSASINSQAAIDGKVYGLYTERPSSRQGIIIREDWLDNLKMKKPETLEDLYEVIRRFTVDDPDLNGKKDTIGLVDRNDLVFGAFKTLGSYFGTPNNWGVVDNAIVPEFETQSYMDTMDFMRKLNTEGLMNAEFAVTSKELQRDQMIRGAAGVYIGSMTDIQRLSLEAKELNPEARFTIVNRILGPEGYRVWSIPNYNGLYLFSKQAIRTEEELLAMLAFFDRTMDKDVANILKYGLEDKHYTLKDKDVFLPVETSQLRIKEINALYTLMIADLSNPNVMNVAEKEPLMELAEKLSEDNNKFLVNDPTIGLESMTYDELNQELYQIISDATYNYILGNIGVEGFQREIERWKQKGGATVIQEYTEAYFKKE